MSENTVLDYLHAYSNHDVEKITSFYEDDIEIYDGAFDETTKGKASAQTEVVEVFLSLVPDLNWCQREGTQMHVDGDVVCVEWVFSGTPNETLEGIPEECRVPFTCKGMSRFKINRDNGRIISHADYYNPPAFFAYL